MKTQSGSKTVHWGVKKKKKRRKGWGVGAGQNRGLEQTKDTGDQMGRKLQQKRRGKEFKPSLNWRRVKKADWVWGGKGTAETNERW